MDPILSTPLECRISPPLCTVNSTFMELLGLYVKIFIRLNTIANLYLFFLLRVNHLCNEHSPQIVFTFSSSPLTFVPYIEMSWLYNYLCGIEAKSLKVLVVGPCWVLTDRSGSLLLFVVHVCLCHTV